MYSSIEIALLFAPGGHPIFVLSRTISFGHHLQGKSCLMLVTSCASLPSAQDEGSLPTFVGR